MLLRIPFTISSATLSSCIDIWENTPGILIESSGRFALGAGVMPEKDSTICNGLQSEVLEGHTWAPEWRAPNKLNNTRVRVPEFFFQIP